MLALAWTLRKAATFSARLAVTLLAFVSMGVTLWSAVCAAEESFRCLEECQQYRQDRESAYKECEAKADAMEDRMAKVRHKQYCRKRQETVVECDRLRPCAEIKFSPSATPSQAPEPEASAVKSLENFSLVVLQTRPGQSMSEHVFYAGQTVWVRYELGSLQSRGDQYFFDQIISIFNEKGEEIFHDKESFQRERSLTVRLNFKSSIHIPQEFSPGNYRLKVSLRERLSAWTGDAEAPFRILP